MYNPITALQSSRNRRSARAWMALPAAMVAMTAWAFGSSAAHAQEPPTRIIDHFAIDKALLNKPGQRRSSIDFDSKPELGPVWVALNYIGRPTGSTRDAVTSFVTIVDRPNAVHLTSFGVQSNT